MDRNQDEKRKKRDINGISIQSHRNKVSNTLDFVCRIFLFSMQSTFSTFLSPKTNKQQQNMKTKDRKIPHDLFILSKGYYIRLETTTEVEKISVSKIKQLY